MSLICQDCVKSRQDETEAKISMTASSCFTTREQHDRVSALSSLIKIRNSLEIRFVESVSDARLLSA